MLLPHFASDLHRNVSLFLLSRGCSSVLVWDIRPPRAAVPYHSSASAKEDGARDAGGVPATFKHLNLTWKPLLKVRPRQFNLQVVLLRYGQKQSCRLVSFMKLASGWWHAERVIA